MMQRRRVLAAFCAPAAALAVAACATRSPPLRWYSLVSAGASPVRVAAAAGAVTLSIGPVSVPDEVDRAELVLRQAGGAVTLLEGHRWSAPLSSELPRALALAIARRRPQALVGAYPDTVLVTPQWRLVMDVQRFELRSGTPGQASLRVLWSWRAARGQTTPARLTDLTVAAEPGSGLPGLVAAMRIAVQRLADAAADALPAAEPASAGGKTPSGTAAPAS